MSSHLQWNAGHVVERTCEGQQMTSPLGRAMERSAAIPLCDEKASPYLDGNIPVQLDFVTQGLGSLWLGTQSVRPETTSAGPPGGALPSLDSRVWSQNASPSASKLYSTMPLANLIQETDTVPRFKDHPPAHPFKTAMDARMSARPSLDDVMALNSVCVWHHEHRPLSMHSPPYDVPPARFVPTALESRGDCRLTPPTRYASEPSNLGLGSRAPCAESFGMVPSPHPAQPLLYERPARVDHASSSARNDHGDSSARNGHGDSSARNGPGDRGGTRGRPRNPRAGTTRSRDRPVTTNSKLLSKLRSAHMTRDWTIHRIQGSIVQLCRDQVGSRFVQHRLEAGDRVEQQLVLQEVNPALPSLCHDMYGNFVVQKLLQYGSPTVRRILRDSLTGHLLVLSLHIHGCRVVQTALETLDENDLPRLLHELHGHVGSCVQDANGNHVIQKAIETMSRHAATAASIGEHHRALFLGGQIDFILDGVAAHTLDLANHPFGCRVLQRVLEHCGGRPQTIAILGTLQLYHASLLDSPYGNFVIQHVVQYGRDGDRDSLVQLILRKGVLHLSRLKLASNVVEKVLMHGCPYHQLAVIREMLQIVNDPSTGHPSSHGQIPVVVLMVRDAYANYVVQTALQVVPSSNERRVLFHVLLSHIDEMRRYTFAKHIVALLDATDTTLR